MSVKPSNNALNLGGYVSCKCLQQPACKYLKVHRYIVWVGLSDDHLRQSHWLSPFAPKIGEARTALCHRAELRECHGQMLRQSILDNDCKAVDFPIYNTLLIVICCALLFVCLRHH